MKYEQQRTSFRYMLHGGSWSTADDGTTIFSADVHSQRDTKRLGFSAKQFYDSHPVGMYIRKSFTKLGQTPTPSRSAREKPSLLKRLHVSRAFKYSKQDIDALAEVENWNPSSTAYALLSFYSPELKKTIAVGDFVCLDSHNDYICRIRRILQVPLHNNSHEGILLQLLNSKVTQVIFFQFC